MKVTTKELANLLLYMDAASKGATFLYRIEDVAQTECNFCFMVADNGVLFSYEGSGDNKAAQAQIRSAILAAQNKKIAIVRVFNADEIA